MDQAIKNAAIQANLSALRAILESALLRAVEAEKAILEGQNNQAIGAAIGLETMLDEARALYSAALALHRGAGR
jgi:hypothetical protein